MAKVIQPQRSNVTIPVESMAAGTLFWPADAHDRVLMRTTSGSVALDNGNHWQNAVYDRGTPLPVGHSITLEQE